MRITAIVPNYNHARFLSKRLQSVYGQSYPGLEVIILDDASNDNSREIMEEFRCHPRTKAIVYNKDNSGSPFLQWEKGIALADTEWIWICESDDYCEIDFLESLLPGMRDPQCVLAYQEAIWVDENEQVIKAPYQYKSFCIPGKTFIRQYMLSENRLVNAGMLAFKKTAFDEVNLDWTGYRQSGDYRLFTEIMGRGSVWAGGHPKVYFRRHAQTVSATWLNTDHAWQEKLKTWRFLLQNKFIRPADFRSAGLAVLKQLYISKAAANDQYYLSIRTRWLNWLKEQGVIITDFEARVSALWSKLKHYFRKQLIIKK